MADMFSQKKRSLIMASIRSRGNLTTESVFITAVKRARVTGWRRHLPIDGKPDFCFPTQRVAVFIDGCFWHCCPKHGTNPKSNTSYWGEKLRKNRLRDQRVRRLLNKKGWKVLRFWEHGLDEERIISRLRRALKSNVMPLQQGQ